MLDWIWRIVFLVIWCIVAGEVLVAIQLGALFKSLIYMIGFIPLFLKFSKNSKKKT